MLTEADTRHFFTARWILSCLKLIPIQVNRLAGRFEQTKSRWTIAICYLNYAHLLLHTIYLNVRVGLAWSMKQYDARLPYVMAWDMIPIVGTNTACIWYLLLFVLRPEVTVYLSNESSKLDIQKSGRNSKGFLAYLIKHSPQDLIATWLPDAWLVCVLLVVVVYAYEPSFKCSVISIVPENSRTLGVTLLWLTEEFWSHLHAAMICMFGATMHVLCLDKYLRAVQCINGSRGIHACYSQLRHLQLNILWFNEVNAFVTFTFKLLCIFFSLLAGFAGIICSHTNLPFSLLTGILFWSVLLTYSIVYEKAFGIPHGVRNAKKFLIIRVPPRQRSLMVRRLRAIPEFGIRVGSFHTMERASTPIFLDFVVRNLVGLLMF